MRIMLDDEKVWREGYKRLPKECLKIPSLHMMGHAKNGKAWEPLATHYHKTLEIVVMLNGSQEYFVNGTPYALYGGNLFITYPNEEHGNGDRPQNACEFIWFQLDLTPRDDFLGLSADVPMGVSVQAKGDGSRTVRPETDPAGMAGSEPGTRKRPAARIFRASAFHCAVFPY